MRGSTFSKFERFKSTPSQVPGPGNQTNEKVLATHKSLPSFSLGKSPMAQDIKTPNSTPSPGQQTPYSPSFTKEDSIYKHAGRHGKFFQFNSNPGPGAYNSQSVIHTTDCNTSKFNKVASYTMLGKNVPLDKWDTPAPNNYRIRFGSLIVGGQISKDAKMKSRVDDQKLMTGPGSQNNQIARDGVSTQTKNPNQTMGKSKRNDLIMAQVVKSPGPGSQGMYNKTGFGQMESYETKPK